jgi:hypothetical protein
MIAAVELDDVRRELASEHAVPGRVGRAADEELPRRPPTQHLDRHGVVQERRQPDCRELLLGDEARRACRQRLPDHEQLVGVREPGCRLEARACPGRRVLRPVEELVPDLDDAPPPAEHALDRECVHRHPRQQRARQHDRRPCRIALVLVAAADAEVDRADHASFSRTS